MPSPASPPVGRLSPWAPLRHRIFLLLFIAQVASNLGTLMQAVASAWVMGDLGASRALVALVQTATFLPVFVFGLPAGALADIIDRRRLLIAAQGWMMVVAGVMAALAFFDMLTPLNLLLLTLALGLGTAFNIPAWFAIQPELVPKREFSQAVALNALTYNVARAVGPALGGLLLAAAGPGWVFVVNGVSFVAVVGVLMRWRRPEDERSLPAESLRGAMRAGMRYAANAPVLRAVLARTTLYVFPGVAVQALLPVTARENLNLGSGGYGLLLGCFGLGAATAAAFLPRLQERLAPDRLLAINTAVLLVVLVVEALVPQTVLVAIALVLGGFVWATGTTVANVAAQSALPEWVRARGMGLFSLVITGSVSIGAAMWGGVAEWGVTGAYLGAAACLLVSMVAVRRWPLAPTQGLDLSAVPGEAPEVTFMPHSTDGPVLVTLTYDVPQPEAARFAEAMRDVERARRGTGAFQWSLYRDLSVPDRYLETFAVESWAEHVRQHHRRTAGDTHIEIVLAYSNDDPQVSHYVSAYSHGALGEVSEAMTLEPGQRPVVVPAGLAEEVDAIETDGLAADEPDEGIRSETAT
jgi:MFS family permease